MFPVSRAELPGNRARPLTLEELEGRKEAARAGYQERREGQGAVELTAEQMEGMALRNSGEGGKIGGGDSKNIVEREEWSLHHLPYMYL